jgi:transaldolase
MGGDLILSMPHEWQLKFNESDIVVEERMSQPVDPRIVQAMYHKIPDFPRLR